MGGWIGDVLQAAIEISEIKLTLAQGEVIMGKGKFVTKKQNGNLGGVTLPWKFYTELPSGIKLVESGCRPDREADAERAWSPSSFSSGAIHTTVWNLTDSELKSAIRHALGKKRVYVEGEKNVIPAIEQLSEMGFLVHADDWAELGYIASGKE